MIAMTKKELFICNNKLTKPELKSSLVRRAKNVKNLLRSIDVIKCEEVTCVFVFMDLFWMRTISHRKKHTLSKGLLT